MRTSGEWAIKMAICGGEKVVIYDSIDELLDALSRARGEP